MKNFIVYQYLLGCLTLGLLSLAVQAGPTVSQAPKNARVYFVTPADGAQISSPVKVKFGLQGMTVVPAGVPHPDSGHHHLLVNVAELPPLNKPIPSDKNHRHFGKGQTETQLELSPGKHTLQLLLGDHLHRPHNKPVLSEKITITVLPKP